MDEQLYQQLIRSRRSAESRGEAACDALRRGDIGQARTAARQAAQHARIVMQLETGVKQSAPEEIAGDEHKEGRPEQRPE